jgi:hypothetical protein
MASIWPQLQINLVRKIEEIERRQSPSRLRSQSDLVCVPMVLLHFYNFRRRHWHRRRVGSCNLIKTKEVGDYMVKRDLQYLTQPV